MSRKKIHTGITDLVSVAHGAAREAGWYTAPAEGKIGTVHWDCLYCKQRLNKFNSADCDTFCCGNHECHSFGKAQWVVAADRGIHEGDKTVAVTVRANPDGSQTVTDIREIVDSRARLSRIERVKKGESK